MPDVECFMVHQVDRASRELRRYSSERCENHAYRFHNAGVAIGDVPWDHGDFNGSDIRFPHDDPRWPVKCDACEYLFVVSDNWQAHDHRYFQSEDGHEWPIYSLPAGAMMWGNWMWRAKCSPHLFVMLPLGGNVLWCIDGPDMSGGFWERTGEPPNISVTPSIQCASYHGFLTDGILREC